MGNGVATTTSTTTAATTAATATGPAIEPRQGLDSLLPGVQRRLEVSYQQWLIIRMIVTEGLESKLIAARLGVSLNSVNTQIERIYKKLKVRNRAALVSKVWMKVMEMREEERKDFETRRADPGAEGRGEGQDEGVTPGSVEGVRG